VCQKRERSEGENGPTLEKSGGKYCRGHEDIAKWVNRRRGRCWENGLNGMDKSVRKSR
jgi:hypothetical protein